MCVREGGRGSNCGIKWLGCQLPAGHVTSVAVCMWGWMCWCVETFHFWSLTFYYNYVQLFRLTVSLFVSVCLCLCVTAFTNACRFSSSFRNNLWGYPAWSVICVRVCMSMQPRVCVSLVYESERDRDMRVGVCMCASGCVGGGDMVYGCGCEGRQNENSDYTRAEYISY